MSAKATVWLFLAGTAGLAAAAGALDSPVPPGAVARVGDETITEQQLAAIISAPLTELRMRENMLRTQGLDELIAQRVLAREAASRGLTAPALMKAEVEDKSAPTEAGLRAYYEANKDRFKNVAEADAFKQIEPGLRQQQQRARQAAFLRELRQKYAVKVLLEPLRVGVDTAGAPVRGNVNAPVTIVEFSDFQCPFCVRARPTVNRVREVYGDKVRILFRDFPLQMHPQATKAAEAAACAGEQGKFWEMHDRLFASQTLLVPDLKRYAAELGLKAETFDTCLDSGRHAAEWTKGLADGARYGVTGTPAFFINGRPLVGARPFEDFAQVIDDELDRGGSAPAPVPAATMAPTPPAVR
jgi:predicted DsbA family dithiol-disulfide isomerase